MAPRRGRPRHPDALTPAEWRVLDLHRHGLARGEIAALRRTSVDAVKYHLANIAGKLGVPAGSLRRWPGVPATSPLAARRNGQVTTDAGATPASTDDLALGPIGQVSLFVRDVARAEAFYGETLGLPHFFTFGDLAFFDCGGTRLYLHRKDEADWQPGSILYFLVGDIHAAQSGLEARGIRFTGAPHMIYADAASGVEEWMTFFEDGEGNKLALMARVPRAD
ncbi:MAG TPA: VOC family protein [Candidatus Limnocylindrales bacterium]|nr:VOC family protein [Candidatus Limnocylindrales bacterium]